MWKLLFSFRGRINRAKFWAVYLPVIALALVLQYLRVASPSLAADDGFWLVVASAAALVLVWIFFAIQTKRWQDQGKSARWRILLNFIPVVGIAWIFVECGMLRGTVGANEYGPDPLEPERASGGDSGGAVVTGVARSTAERTSAQSDVSEKYAMLLKFSERARAAEAQLRHLPGNLQERFKREAVANPGRVEEIAGHIIAEEQERLSPFGDPKLDALYQRLEAHGPQAQAEFQQAVAFLKGHVDPEKVFLQIVNETTKIAELPNASARVMPAGFAPSAGTQAGSPSASLDTLQGRMADIARQTDEIRRAMGGGKRL